jgi:hypothetical protein
LSYGDDDPPPIDAVQCQLVDRASQTRLHPEGTSTSIDPPAGW